MMIGWIYNILTPIEIIFFQMALKAFLLSLPPLSLSLALLHFWVAHSITPLTLISPNESETIFLRLPSINEDEDLP